MMENNDSRGDRDVDDQTSARSGRSGPSVALIGFVLLAVLAVVFFLQNGERSNIDFLVFEERTTIRWSLMVAVVIGVVLDRLISFWWRRRRRRS